MCACLLVPLFAFRFLHAMPAHSAPDAQHPAREQRSRALTVGHARRAGWSGVQQQRERDRLSPGGACKQLSFLSLLDQPNTSVTTPLSLSRINQVPLSSFSLGDHHHNRSARNSKYRFLGSGTVSFGRLRHDKTKTLQTIVQRLLRSRVDLCLPVSL